jgi:hypothetical protein
LAKREKEIEIEKVEKRREIEKRREEKRDREEKKVETRNLFIAEKETNRYPDGDRRKVLGLAPAPPASGSHAKSD